MKEHMSALVDGELEMRAATEVIDVLIEDEELRVRWSRYHMVRDVLRHKVYPDARDTLCDRVRNCLSDEPLHFPASRWSPRQWRHTLKPMAGMALAASVAVIAILAVRGLDPPTDVPQRAELASPTGGAVIPASATSQGQIRPASLKRLQWNTTEPAVANRLNGYLVNHSEHLGGPIRGMHPYARIVGYDTSDQR